MKIFVCLLFCLAGGLLAWKIYPLIYDFCNRTKYYNCYISKAKIVRKRYQEAVTSNYKKRLQYHPEVFDVFLEIDGKKHLINNERIFKTFNVGDEIYVQVREAYNPKGEKKYTIIKA